VRAVLVALAACASCATTWSYEEFDRLSRTSQAKTIVHQPSFSLFSPYDPSTTQEWVERVETLDARLATLLGPHSRSWIVVLVPNEEMLLEVHGPGNSVTVPVVAIRTKCGIGGFAYGRTANLYVPPAARAKLMGHPMSLVGTGEDAARKLMHELSHLYLNDLGIEAPWWLCEGFAHLVEDAPVRDGCPDLDGAKSTADELARFSEEELDLDRLLTFREDIGSIAKGVPHPYPESRRVARAFVQYEISRSKDAIVGTLRKLSGTPRSELLAAEPGWREWLRSHAEAGNAPADH
jgi:hypothetical protein